MRKGILRMSQKERDRLRILSRVKAGEMMLRKAAELLGICYRQCKRIYKRYREEGEKGLVHRSRGRSSNRRKDLATREAVIKRYQERYEGFGPTLACEKLEEEGYHLDHETLRLWLLEEGLWEKRRKRKKHRSWRERKEHFGEMVQIDGSHHDWFEGRREKAVLINMVDDATGRTLSRVHEGETTRATMETVWEYIDEHGIPLSIYADGDSIYITDRQPNISEELKGEKPLTQLGRTLHKLGVKIITARSAQAKGRVERSHGVYQDRLVKELRLAGINSITEANNLLEGSFLEELNDRFAREPKSDVDLHRPVPEGLDLRSVFCFEEGRVVDNDWTVRWRNRIFQITKANKILPRARQRVTVQEWLDGSIHLVYRGKELRYRELDKKPLREKKKITAAAERKPYRPAADHPWRRWRYSRRVVA